MDASLLTALIGAGAGLVSGTVASLIAPWVRWGIEKRRARMESRRDLIAEAREYIGSKSFYGAGLTAKPIYPRLKPHLRSDLVEVIENFGQYRDQQDDPTKFPEELRKEMLDEISRVERKWRLI